jgi:glycosyltransferase involved in cell wall biosynthesis
MLEFMSCARPVVLGVGGQAERILKEAGAGISVKAEDAPAIATAIRQMYGDAELRRRSGENGRSYMVSKMSRVSTAQDYLQVLARVTGKSATIGEVAAATGEAQG